jgi:hypothetical protein
MLIKLRFDDCFNIEFITNDLNLNLSKLYFRLRNKRTHYPIVKLKWIAWIYTIYNKNSYYFLANKSLISANKSS